MKRARGLPPSGGGVVTFSPGKTPQPIKKREGASPSRFPQSPDLSARYSFAAALASLRTRAALPCPFLKATRFCPRHTSKPQQPGTSWDGIATRMSPRYRILRAASGTGDGDADVFCDNVGFLQHLKAQPVRCLLVEEPVLRAFHVTAQGPSQNRGHSFRARRI